MDPNLGVAIPDKFSRYLSFISRVPLLFFLDEILKVSFGLISYSSNTEDEEAEEILGETLEETEDDVFSHRLLREYNLFKREEENGRLEKAVVSLFNGVTRDYWNASKNTYHEPLLMPFVSSTCLPMPLKVLFLVSGFLLVIGIFMLSWENLKKLYNVVGSGMCISLSYIINYCAVLLYFHQSSPSEPTFLEHYLGLDIITLYSNPAVTLVTNYVLQALLCLCFIHLQFSHNDFFILKAFMWAFLLPSGSMLVTFSKEITLSITMIGALLPALLLFERILRGVPYVFFIFNSAIADVQAAIPVEGLHTLLERDWKRLNVPYVLRVFWSLRAANFVVFFIASNLQDLQTTNILLLMNPSFFFSMFKATLTYGCDTAMALLGMTSIVSYFCHHIEVVFLSLLMADDRDDRSMGTVSAVLFFVLAEQSGLTILDDEKRFIRLCRNFCLLFTAMLYLVHNMVNPVLMSLSASRNPSVSRHVRALFVCFTLLSLPLILLYVLWSVFDMSTWLLAVSTFSFQVILKTTVTVLIYGIFLADSYYSLFWENLDDYVYYIKAFGNTVEFVFGIVLFFNGLWIYFFESGGAIRAIMMCVHAYVNLWCEAKNGWSVFIKRRNAVKKVASIPDATPHQLEVHDDVCTICFQRLSSAKITRCNHFYHELCLRKWLYVQDSCPLCHQILYSRDPPREGPGDIAQLQGLVEGMANAPVPLPVNNQLPAVENAEAPNIVALVLNNEDPNGPPASTSEISAPSTSQSANSDEDLDVSAHSSNTNSKPDSMAESCSSSSSLREDSEVKLTQRLGPQVRPEKKKETSDSEIGKNS